MGRIVELFAGVITTLFCCSVPVVAFTVVIMGLYNVEFVAAFVELDGELPIGVNVMWIIIEPLVVLVGNVIIPVVIDGV